MSQIQPGRHKATVSSATVGESKNKGTLGAFVTFSTDQGEINAFFALTEKAKPYTAEKLYAIGCDIYGLAGQAYAEKLSNIGDTVGNVCVIVVKMGAPKQNGESWPEVAGVYPEQSSAPSAELSTLSRLLARESAIIRPADKPKLAPQPKTAPKPAPAAQEEGDPY